MITAMRQTVYRAFGLRLSSGFPLPELPVSGDDEGREDADIVIETADPDGYWEDLKAAGGNFERRGGRFLFLIPETAIFCLDEDGSKMIVAPLAGADHEKVRVYLLGTGMGALLMIRKTLPLHGSAVVIDGKAYAFLGESGAGKSTLAAAFVGRGHRLASDDVIAVHLPDRGGTPTVLPSYPQQKLWQASIDRLGMSSAPYRPVYRDQAKYAVPVDSRFCEGPVPLAGVFELVKSEGKTVGVRHLPILERLRVPMQHTYRSLLIPRLGLEQWHFSTAASIADRVPVYRLERPIEGFTAHRLVSAIIRTIQEGEKIR